MTFNRKFLVVASLAAIVTTAVAFTAPAPPDPGFKNLKILDKNISNDQLHKIMHDFNVALGVKCNFCHAPSKDTAVKWPDFASDDKPEKNIARSMMKMTLKINKKFFEAKHPFIGDSTLTVTCITCHHGNPHPEDQAEAGGHMEHMGDHPPGPPPPGGNH